MADIADWMRGNGTDALKGNTNASLIDDNTTAYIQDPLDRLLDNYKQGCQVRYGSDKTVIISIGEITVENSAGDARRMRQNTAEVTLTMPDIGSSGDSLDTGNAALLQYYVYAVGDADATTFTGIISASNTFPTGATYVRKIGYFTYAEGDGTGEVTSVGNVGGSGNISYSFATDDLTLATTPTSWTTIPYLSHTFIAVGGRTAKVSALLPMRFYGYGWVRILSDGVSIGQGGWNAQYFGVSNVAIIGQTNIIVPYTFAAGTHTITVQLKGGSSSYTRAQTRADDGTNCILVEE